MKIVLTSPSYPRDREETDTANKPEFPDPKLQERRWKQFQQKTSSPMRQGIEGREGQLILELETSKMNWGFYSEEGREWLPGVAFQTVRHTTQRWDTGWPSAMSPKDWGWGWGQGVQEVEMNSEAEVGEKVSTMWGHKADEISLISIILMPPLKAEKKSIFWVQTMVLRLSAGKVRIETVILQKEILQHNEVMCQIVVCGEVSRKSPLGGGMGKALQPAVSVHYSKGR